MDLRSLIEKAHVGDARRPLIADGAIATALSRQITDSAFETGRPGAIELLNQQRPDAVVQLHRAYIEAGARMITTNTFCASAIHSRLAGRRESVGMIIKTGVEMARRAIDQSGSQSSPAVLGSCGPLPADPKRRDAYREQVAALLSGGVDAVLLETVYSLASLEDAWAAVMAAQSDTPVIVTYSPIGNTIGLEDASLDDLLTWVADHDPTAFGINCGDGEELTYRALSKIRDRYVGPLVVLPSAGLPQIGPAGAVYPLDAEAWSRQVARWAAEFSPAIVGGCCGTTPAYIRQLVKRLTTK